MSSIFGIVSRGSAPVPDHLITRMADPLAGPHVAPAAIWTNGPARFGRREPRHALSTAEPRPPVVSYRDLTVMLDGWLDNRVEIATALGYSQAEAEALPDAALAAHTADRWGPAGLARLIGDFVVTVWEASRARLIVLRSVPHGRPLYYLQHADYIAFASFPRALTSLPGSRRTVNQERIASLLLSVPAPDLRSSLFAGIQRLLPGELLIIQDGQISVREWWRAPDRVDTTQDLAGAPAALDTLLGRVVREQSRGAARVGVMLSGGLDSATVAATASRVLEADTVLRGYTQVPDDGITVALPEGRYADETPRVQALAQMTPRLDVELIRTGQRGLLDGVDDLFTFAEMPFTNAANRPWMEAIYERAARDGVPVLLNGTQGNLTFSWDGHGLIRELLQQRHPWQAIATAWAIAVAEGSRSPARLALKRLLGQGIQPLLPPSWDAPIARLRRRSMTSMTAIRESSLIASDFLASQNLDASLARLSASLAQPAGRDARLRRAFIVIQTGALTAELEAGYEERYGVVSRCPPADRRILEYTLSLPEAAYAELAETRLLVRRAMADRLPPAILETRGRRGLQAPDWFGRIAAEQTRLLDHVGLFEADALVSHVLDLPRLRRLLENYPPEPPSDPAAFALYRGGLPLAMMVGSFLLWAQRTP